VLAGDRIHDLDAVQRAGDRTEEPFPPGARVFVIAGIHQRDQREGGVAQPAKPVVPIALATQPLRQRGGWRRNDAAGRKMGERLERDQRALRRLRPFPGRFGDVGPGAPERLGLAQGFGSVDHARQCAISRTIGQNEGDGLSRRNSELADRGEIFAAQLNRRAQHHHVRAAHSTPASALWIGDPLSSIRMAR